MVFISVGFQISARLALIYLRIHPVWSLENPCALCSHIEWIQKGVSCCWLKNYHQNYGKKNHGNECLIPHQAISCTLPYLLPIYPLQQLYEVCVIIKILQIRTLKFTEIKMLCLLKLAVLLMNRVCTKFA